MRGIESSIACSLSAAAQAGGQFKCIVTTEHRDACIAVHRQAGAVCGSVGDFVVIGDIGMQQSGQFQFDGNVALIQ